MLDGEALVESVRGLSGVVVETPFNLPSSHLEFHHLSTLSRRLDEIAASHPDAGLVLTMGTDTLEEAAYFSGPDLHPSESRGGDRGHARARPGRGGRAAEHPGRGLGGGVPGLPGFGACWWFSTGRFTRPGR